MNLQVMPVGNTRDNGEFNSRCSSCSKLMPQAEVVVELMGKIAYQCKACMYSELWRNEV